MRNDKEDFDFSSPADSAWRLFEKTGNVSYYLLYSNLTKPIKSRREKHGRKS